MGLLKCRTVKTSSPTLTLPTVKVPTLGFLILKHGCSIQKKPFDVFSKFRADKDDYLLHQESSNRRDISFFCFRLEERSAGLTLALSLYHSRKLSAVDA